MELEAILTKRSTHALRRIQRQHGPGETAFVAVVCDNCLRHVQAPTVPQLAAKLQGWYVDDQIGREIDYCPDCVERVL